MFCFENLNYLITKYKSAYFLFQIERLDLPVLGNFYNGH